MFQLTRLRIGSVMTMLCVMNAGAPARAQTDVWTSHVDPSVVSDIEFRNGELFIASSGGLLIFDTASGAFEQFTNTIGLPANELTSLVFDDKGDLYVGTRDAGVARLESVAGGFEVTPINATFHGLADDRITSLSAWGDTIVYGTEAGAGLIIQGFAGPRFLKRDGLPSEFVADVYGDGDRAWVATDSGVVYIDRRGFVQSASTGLPDMDAKAFARADTAVWVGTVGGVAWFDTSSGSWIGGGLAGENVFSLHYDGQSLWAGARRRFYDNAGSGWSSHDALPMHQKYQLVTVRSEIRAIRSLAPNEVYLGLVQPNVARGAHLIRFDGSVVTDLSIGGPPMNQLIRVAIDLDNSVWVSSVNFGVGKLHPTGVWFNYNRSTGDTNLSSRFSNTSLLADSQGSKWFCTLAFEPTTFLLDRLQDQLDLDYANDVWSHDSIGDGGGDGLGSLRNQRAVEDPAGNRWFVSDEEEDAPPDWIGISILNATATAWRHVTPVSTGGAMPGANVIDVAFGPDGDAYVALRKDGIALWSTGGYDEANLFNLADDTWQMIATTSGTFNGGEVLCATYRSDGVLWVGTEEGAYKRENGRWRHFPANRGFGVGLLSNVVNDLQLDHDEDLWLATSLGLNRIARDDDNDILSFTTPVIWQTQLNLFFPPSVVSPIVGGICNALALHPTKDVLYIATIQGLSEFDYSAVTGPPQGLSLNDAYVYPNPVMGNRGDTELRIANIDSEVTVEVYTLEGERIHRTVVSQPEATVWSLTTASPDGNVLASSGVYLVRISNSQGSVVRRVAVLH